MKKKFVILGGILGCGLIYKKLNSIQKEIEYAEKNGMNLYKSKKEMDKEYHYEKFIANHSKKILKSKALRNYVRLRYGFNEEYIIECAKKNI